MSKAANELNPEEIAHLLFNILSLAVDRKNTALERMPVARPVVAEGRKRPRKAELLYITKQTDSPGQFKIDIDWPTERLAIKNHYLVRSVVYLDGSGIELKLGASLEPQRFAFADHQLVLQAAQKAIATYQ
ncbi:MAG: hypothetical protein ACD_81C00188G0009 [uncultured bacterium]|uniref:Uncharacterized protein n=1 Tax=Candidatus Wolfebacteria bacterium GW2011_GWE2_44_13 TaxID=1619017 RepID=A0A0G1HAI5_9BACT|nr:MAG: hypothetical protein ACD_81C00188G0009 [uncultured bacterium]KKT43785.1 MAG: hypothetical protein UW32_C0001G0377 [Candidatus Wolfebacteria bacterium GW2011_GWE2_44_13]